MDFHPKIKRSEWSVGFGSCEIWLPDEAVCRCEFVFRYVSAFAHLCSLVFLVLFLFFSYYENCLKVNEKYMQVESLAPVISRIEVCTMSVILIPLVPPPTASIRNSSLPGVNPRRSRRAGAHKHTADRPTQLFTLPLQTFQRSSSGGKWSPRAS